MKNNIKFFSITVIALVIGLFSLSCATNPPDEEILNAPSNITITVTGRTMVVTWDDVNNASGYEIITDSENCGSGKRKINTRDITAIVYNTANTPPEGDNAMNKVKTDGTQANGSVIILAKNKIQITLMPQMMGDQNVPMATAVTAKVKSLGQTVSETTYTDSNYSETVRKVLSGGGM